MSRDGSGVYNLPESAFVYDTVIDETAVNSNFSDIAAALTASISKDGQTLPTANLAMGGFKHTGASNATARTDYASAGQVQDSALTECGTAGGTKNAITLSPTPAISAYVSGQKFHFKAGATQSDDAVTIAVSGLPAKAAQLDDAALSATIYIEASKHYEALYDGAAFQLDRISVGGLRAANNLSDLASASTARTNLSVYSIAQVDAIATSGATMAITAGEDLADRDLCYLDAFNQRGGGAGKAYKVDADAVGPVRIGKTLCIALSSISSGATGSAQVSDGAVTGFSGLTPGTPIYASATAGALTQAVPAIPADGTQLASRFIGVATSSTAIWFSPDEITNFSKYGAATAVAGFISVESYADSGNRERDAMAYLVTSGSSTTSSTSAAWAGSAFTHSADDITGVSGAIKGVGSFSGDFSVSFQPQNNNCAYFGFYPVSSDASFNSAVQTGGIALTAGAFAWSDGSGGIAYASGSNVYAPGVSYNTVHTFARVGSTVTLSRAGSVVHTFAAASSGTVRLFAGANGAGQWTNVSWVDSSSIVRNEPVTIGSETVNGSATDRVNVKFSDSSDANQDTVTTFYNRTGAERKLIAQVVI